MSAMAWYAVLALLPCFAATLAGGALGCGLALAVRWSTARAGVLRRFGVLAPWRAVVVFLPLPFSHMMLLYFVRTLKRPPPRHEDLLAAGLAVCLVAWFSAATASIVLSHWDPPALPVRLAGQLRWLVAAAFAGALQLGPLGGGGAGFVLIQEINLLRFEEALNVYLGVAALALAVDVALGAFEWLLARGYGRARRMGVEGGGVMG